MGLFTSCCKPSVSDVPTPDAETKRRQLVEAAEKRRQEDQNRGLGRLAQLQKQNDEVAKREQELKSSGGPALKLYYDTISKNTIAYAKPHDGLKLLSSLLRNFEDMSSQTHEHKKSQT